MTATPIEPRKSICRGRHFEVRVTTTDDGWTAQCFEGANRVGARYAITFELAGDFGGGASTVIPIIMGIAEGQIREILGRG